MKSERITFRDYKHGAFCCVMYGITGRRIGRRVRETETRKQGAHPQRGVRHEGGGVKTDVS